MDSQLEGFFLAVVGPSGSGKSSVVKAGLIPAIRESAIPGSARWFVVEMTPGSHPMEELETALLRIAIETPVDLERAICGPAEGVGVHMEAALVARIIQEVGDQPGVLPLLQYALTELFKRRGGNQLTLVAYEESGGVMGALGRRAEEIFSSLNETEGEAARQLFLRLVTLGEGVEDTRRRVLRAEMESVISDPSSVNGSVIDQFGRFRFITFDHDPATRAPTVEVAHEALLREWPRLRLWLDESRDDVRMQRLLEVSVQEWRKSGNDTSFLLHGTRLDQFEIWAGDTDVALTAAEAAYLVASMAARRERKAAEVERQAHEAALEQRSKRFLQALVGVFAAAMIIAVVLSIYAFNLQRTAQIEAQQRATQQVLAEAEAQARATAQSEAEEERAIAEEQTQLTLARELAFASANNLDVAVYF